MLKCRGSRCRKMKPGSSMCWEILTLRIDALRSDEQRGSVETQRLNHDVRSGEAQLAQWIAEKDGQEAGLSRVRERVGQIDHGMQGLQQRFTEAQLVAQGSSDNP